MLLNNRATAERTIVGGGGGEGIVAISIATQGWDQVELFAVRPNELSSKGGVIYGSFLGAQKTFGYRLFKCDKQRKRIDGVWKGS